MVATFIGPPGFQYGRTFCLHSAFEDFSVTTPGLFGVELQPASSASQAIETPRRIKAAQPSALLDLPDRVGLGGGEAGSLIASDLRRKCGRGDPSSTS